MSFHKKVFKINISGVLKNFAITFALKISKGYTFVYSACYTWNIRAKLSSP